MSQNYEYFGKYILLEKMAAGGMAEVFLARAPGAGGIGKFVAIKRILPQFSDNKEFIEMFKDEAKIAINLGHSNIVSIYEFGVEQGQFFLVMDYVKGRNVRQILNKMKQSDMQFSVDQIVFMSKEIAAGLDHAHRCLDGTTGKPLNITHRDMSPQNVMVSFEGEIKIIDFGIAKAETQMENTRAGTLKGKFGYMSPEQAEGQSVDLRTDIFSLGIVLWELLANDRLFIANNEINTLRKIRDCNIPSLMKINSEVQPELERICLKALTKDRNLRYQTAAALHRDLSRFLNRHYPDFSPHDFSMFVKSLYADEILDLNNQLVEHSKIPFREVIPLHSTPAEEPATGSGPSPGKESTRTITNAPGATNPKQFDGVDFQIQRAIPKEVLHPQAPNNSSNTNVATVVANPNANTATNVTVKKEHSFVTAGSAPAQLNLQSAYNYNKGAQGAKPKSQFSNNTGTNSSIRIQKPVGGTFRTYFMMVSYSVAAVLSYLVLTATMPNLMEPVNSMVNSTMYDMGVCADYENNQLVKSLKGFRADQALCPPQKGASSDAPKNKKWLEEQLTPPPTTANEAFTIGVIFNSQPSGAEIFVDGEDMKRTTPARVDLLSDKRYNIELRKKNYNSYLFESFDPNSAESKNIHAILEKIIVAYIDIDVQPPRFAQVYVNGNRVKTKNLPIIRYPVTANQPVVVSAENPLSKAKDSKRILLEEGQRKTIVLNLKREPASTK